MKGEEEEEEEEGGGYLSMAHAHAPPMRHLHSRPQHSYG
jgi:hypothetical protein